METTIVEYKVPASQALCVLVLLGSRRGARELMT